MKAWGRGWVACAGVMLITSSALADDDCPVGAFCEEVPATEPPEEPVGPDDEDPPSADATDDAEPISGDDEGTALVLASEDPNWQPEGDVPTDGRADRQSPLFHAGVGIFVAGYSVPFAVGLVSALIVEDAPESAPLIPLMIPVAGPLITGAIVEASDGVWGVLGATSAFQALGLLVMGIGAAVSDDTTASRTIQGTPNGLLVRF